MAKMKKTDNTQYWHKCGVTRSLIYCWEGCELVQPLWKTTWKYLLKPNTCLLYGPETPLLGSHPRGLSV